MTAEIAIMNKEAVALAADSAVTLTMGESDQKVFISANKLFMLSKYCPVGIMIYQNATFMGVHWETIIKVYRNKLGRKKFNTLKEHASHFIKFIEKENSLFTKSVQDEFFKSMAYGYFNLIKEQIKTKLEQEIKNKGKTSSKEIKIIINGIIEEHYERWAKAEKIKTMPKAFSSKVLKSYSKLVNDGIKEIFENLPISLKNISKIRIISANLFSKTANDLKSHNFSGVVVSGFGKNEIFSSVISYHLEGIVCNKLKYYEYISSKINHNSSASIIPFAQSEMVATFMEGIDPYLNNQIEGYIFRIFDKFPEIVIDNICKGREDKKELTIKLKDVSRKIAEEFKRDINVYRTKNYVNPIIEVVSMLPKDEFAAMAESLVSLTSFKRKVTLQKETVGGPIDVAVISKGDGFIWIKRKHYFKAEYNPQFIANYYKEIEDEEKT